MPPPKESQTENIWRAMRKLAPRLLPLGICLFVFPSSSSQTANPQTAWFKTVVPIDTFTGKVVFVFDGDGVRLVEVDTPEVHLSKKNLPRRPAIGMGDRDHKGIKGNGIVLDDE